MLTKQRPKGGGVLSIGPGRFEQLPPFPIYPANPHRLPLVASAGAPEVPAHLQPKYGSASVSQAPFRQQHPCMSHLPDVIGLRSGGSSFAGQELPSLHDALSDCLTAINQLREQYQPTPPMDPAPSQNALAAASSSSTLSQSSSQQFEVRITIQLKNGFPGLKETCDAHREYPLTVRNRIHCGQGVREEGSRNIKKGRRRNNSATAKRRTYDVEPLEVQVVLEPTVGKGSSVVNGMKYGSSVPPAAVSACAATGRTQRLEGESARDVIVNCKETRKIIHSPDGVDDNDRCRYADTSLSAKMQKSSSININGRRSVSCVIDSVDSQFDWFKKASAVTPVDYQLCDPPAVAAHVHVGVLKKIGLFLNDRRSSFAQIKCVDIKAAVHHPSRTVAIIRRSRSVRRPPSFLATSSSRSTSPSP